MKAIDKLLKRLSSKNIVDDLDEDQCKQIAEDAISGYEADEDSRSNWLDTNRDAMKIIKHCEDDNSNSDKDFPFQGSAKLVYPLLAPAVIQMAARLSTHIVQNDKVCTYAVLGPDTDGTKQEKAERLTNFSSYTFLIESDTWLSDTHKLMSILSGWGTAFRQVYYDPISKKACNELIQPEDVIINHNVSSLEKAPRITVKHYLRKNDIVSLINSGSFKNIDLDTLNNDADGMEDGVDSRETNPTHTFLCQLLYLDLDDDGYAEPYKAYVHEKRSELFGLYPAFKLKDIDFDQERKEEGKILRIKPRIDVVDYHCMDDPEGGFYSIGLNYLLLHPNKTLTALSRQIVDSGTLANTQGGFITKAFKTQSKSLQFEMGQFKVLDVDPNVNPQQHIIPLPFKEPSQVLFAMFQALVQSSKEIGFITDVLTGDVEGQNTPATTMLAMVEQGTRAFKPVVQKLYISLKKEFKLWFEINSEYLEVGPTGKKYATFQGQSIEIAKSDFNSLELDVCPVADPTMSSEAHKYAKLKVLTDILNTPAASAVNVQEVLLRLFEGMNFPNAKALIAQPQPPAPDPKMIKLELDKQKMESKHEIDSLKLQLQQAKIQNEQLKIGIKGTEVQLKMNESDSKQKLMDAKAQHEFVQAKIDAHQAGANLHVQHRKLDLMETQQRNQRRTDNNN